VTVYALEVPKAIQRPAISGRSIAHHKLNNRQKACIAALAYRKEVEHLPTLRQFAAMFGVSPYQLRIALKLSSAVLEAVISGEVDKTFAELGRDLQHCETAMAAAIVTAFAVGD
jgi:hypothetical protein